MELRGFSCPVQPVAGVKLSYTRTLTTGQESTNIAFSSLF